MRLSDSSVAVMLPVDDVDRSQKFYEESLGLEYKARDEEGAARFALPGGNLLMLLPRPGSARTESTALAFEVDDVASTLKELEGRGVRFADYDLPGLRTVDHIADVGHDRAAWFEDPDHNVLCIHQTLA